MLTYFTALPTLLILKLKVQYMVSTFAPTALLLCTLNHLYCTHLTMLSTLKFTALPIVSA